MENTINKQHFKNLLSIAFADGIVDKTELEFLFKKSDRFFITQEEIETLAENSIHIPSLVISDKKERAIKMFELIEMMLVDGEADEREFRLCTSFAVSMGFAADTIEENLKKVLTMLDEGFSNYIVIETLQKFE